MRHTREYNEIKFLFKSKMNDTLLCSNTINDIDEYLFLICFSLLIGSGQRYLWIFPTIDGVPMRCQPWDLSCVCDCDSSLYSSN